MFQTSHPVVGPGFHDRTDEMQRLMGFVAELRAGANRWLAIIGPRKVGKTSMILELSRRITDVDFILVDTQEVSPPSLELFRTCALRVVDQVLGRELDNSLEVLAAAGEQLEAVLDASATFTALPAPLKSTIRALARAEMTDDFARLCLDLPERLAEALQRHIVIAIDEFQELAGLTRGADVLPIIRSTWQRHRRIGYVVSGSGRTLLENMIARQHSPFFQHFSLMYVEPFARAEAIALLTTDGGPGRPIVVEHAQSGALGYRRNEYAGDARAAPRCFVRSSYASALGLHDHESAARRVSLVVGASAGSPTHRC